MATEEIFIGRQPILDRKHQLFAYELLFRSGGQKNEANVQDDLGATASVINHAFAELGVEQALGPYKGFINCDASLLLSDSIEILPTDKIVLEILETVEVTPEIVERCTELKARGFTIALDDFVNYEDKFKPLLDLIEIVKVDLMPLSKEQLGVVTSSLRRWPTLTLLAEKVDSREQADHCHMLGYGLFQGYYFAKPVIIAGKKLGQSQLALVRLLGMVMEDAETSQLEGVFKHEPGLTMNLMRLTNSVSTGVRTKVTSLRHAITVLGRRQLQRWLQDELGLDPADKGLLIDGELDYSRDDVRQAIMRWVDTSIVRPNAAMRPMWASDPHYAVFYHLKSFAYAFHKTILERVINEMKHDNYVPALYMLSIYTPVMIAADAAKELLIIGDKEPAWLKSGLSGAIKHGANRANLTTSGGIPIPGIPGMYAENAGSLDFFGPAVDQVKDFLLLPLNDKTLGGELVGALPFGNVARKYVQ